VHLDSQLRHPGAACGRAAAWLEKHISMAAYLNGAFAVEHRFLAEIVYAARGAGLVVETTN